jgi:ankyrin repeat protein
MLTRARSLFSRVFSLDTPSSQIRLDDPFDDINDDTSDENDTDNIVYDDDIDNSTNGIDNDDDGLSDSDDECRQTSSTKGKYERQINEYPTNNKIKSNVNYTRSHEKSKQNRLVNAMQIATSRCNVESMKRLLTNFDIDINHRDQYGMSYLEHAILMGSFDMIDLLIRYGCDLYQGLIFLSFCFF